MAEIVNNQHAAGLHNKSHNHVPTTRVGDEGTAKRNIHRRHNSGKGKSFGNGGGGKGRWDPTDDGSMAQSDEAILDKRDPNYDSAEDGNYVLVSDSGVVGERSSRSPAPGMTLPEFKKKLTETFEEYFLSEDADEVIRTVRELACPTYNFEVVKRGINMSLDGKDHERELVSRLLSGAYPQTLSSNDIGKGFQRLFEMIDDIQLDAPDARHIVASFLARAVVDETLPPAFLQEPNIKSLGGDIVDGAIRLLSRDHALSRLEKVWGPGDGRPVEEVKVAIDQLVAEYLLSRQLDEAAACVKELNCPFFHHEVVKRAVTGAIDKTDDDRTALSSLLAYLRAEDIVSERQMQIGFDRLWERMPDTQLDCPAAPAMLDKFVEQAKRDECLAPSYTKPKAAGAEAEAEAAEGEREGAEPAVEAAA